MSQQLAPGSGMSTTSAPPRDGFTHANGLPAIPIVLGVVGHRDVPADEQVHKALKDKLSAVFAEFRNAYPNTPLVLLSSLAQGSDQLAAEAALDNGVFVRAPLPFPADVFRQSTSFDTDAMRKKLDGSLADSRVEAFVAPLPEKTAPDDTDWPAVASDRQDAACLKLRRTCYANAGGFIVRNCHALIALWDGQAGDPTRQSGTAEHVKFKLQGQAPAYYPWTDAEPLGFRGDRGPVCVIHTPRSGQRAEDAGALEIRLPDDEEPYGKPIAHQPLARAVRTWRLLWRIQAALPLAHFLANDKTAERSASKTKDAYPAELRQFHEVCQSVDDFNRDIGARKTGKAVAKDVSAIQAKLLKSEAFDAQHLCWFNRLSAVREAAGRLSRRYKPRLDNMHFAVFLLLALSVAVFHFYAHWFEIDDRVHHTVHHPILLQLFAGCLAVACLLVLYVWWRRVDERRLDYRALAEALRVSRAWALAGIGESVADSYQGQLRSEMSWVRRALLDVCPPAQVWARPFNQQGQQQQLDLLHRLKSEWVIEQAKHYEKHHREEQWWAVLLRLCGLILAVAGWLLIIALLLGSVLAPAGHSARTEADGPGDKEAPAAQLAKQAHADAGVPVHPPWTAEYPRHWMLLVSGLLVITGGLCIAFCERRSHEDLAKQYERMHVVFRNGLHELDRRLADKDVAGAQTVLKALGREAIAEHAHWLILRRARPFELHIGG